MSVVGKTIKFQNKSYKAIGEFNGFIRPMVNLSYSENGKKLTTTISKEDFLQVYNKSVPKKVEPDWINNLDKALEKFEDVNKLKKMEETIKQYRKQMQKDDKADNKLKLKYNRQIYKAFNADMIQADMAQRAELNDIERVRFRNVAKAYKLTPDNRSERDDLEKFLEGKRDNVHAALKLNLDEFKGLKTFLLVECIMVNGKGTQSIMRIYSSTIANSQQILHKTQ
jgi:hypothetical protein